MVNHIVETSTSSAVLSLSLERLGHPRAMGDTASPLAGHLGHHDCHACDLCGPAGGFVELVLSVVVEVDEVAEAEGKVRGRVEGIAEDGHPEERDRKAVLVLMVRSVRSVDIVTDHADQEVGAKQRKAHMASVQTGGGRSAGAALHCNRVAKGGGGGREVAYTATDASQPAARLCHPDLRSCADAREEPQLHDRCYVYGRSHVHGDPLKYVVGDSEERPLLRAVLQLMLDLVHVGHHDDCGTALCRDTLPFLSGAATLG